MYVLALLLAATGWAQTRGGRPVIVLPARAAVPAVQAPPARSALPALPTLPSLGDEDALHEAGANLQRSLEGAPQVHGRALPSVAAGPELPGLAAAPQEPGSSAADLLRKVRSRAAREALEQKIYADPLTGLLKRAWVHDHIESILRRNSAIMVLDLDHFKKGINDKFGHDVGDIALSELARIMKETAPPGRVLVRWGGEEFVIVDRMSRSGAVAAAEELRRIIEARLGPAVRRRAEEKLARSLDIQTLTATIGVAPLRSGAELSVFLDSMKEADRALFEGKNGGRNQVRSADQGHWDAARVEPSLWDRALGWLKDLRFRAPAPPPASDSEGLLDGLEDEALREALAKKLYTDALTGLYNRAHLNDHFERLSGTHRAILFVDIDRFKRVNDLHGHVKAGEVLSHLGAILKEFGAGPSYLMGGEEFMVLVDAPAEEAMLLAEKLRADVEARLGPAAGIGPITVSIGVSELDKSLPARAALQSAITAADQALYKAKQDGRNRVTLAKP